MRLDKFIANNTQFSRAQIHSAIKQGLVTLNNETVKNAALHINAEDTVTLNGQAIELRQPRYLMLYKPAGHVSANHDSEHPTLIDLLDLPFKHELQIAGRLDVDTTGLVLLTDDGQWNHRITSPRHMHTKSYLVTTADPIPEVVKAIFAEGVILHGESRPTLPADLTILGPHRARLSICEGKYHQVKRMFAAAGNRVTALHRERIGDIMLDEDLKPGQYRALSATEINSFGKNL